MGLYTQLAGAQLAELADAFALGAVRAVAPIAAGTINSNFDVETDRGRWFVRINEGKSEGDVAWEARLLDELAAAGAPVPAPLRAADHRPYAPLLGKWVSVFAWQPGRHLAAAEVTEAHAAELGAALAALHVAGAALPETWRRRSIYDHNHLVARFARIAASGDPALAHAIDVLGDELAFLTAAAPIRSRAARGIIHGDLFRDNVLWDGARISAILDFEQASGGSFAYDVAVCINDWCWDDGPRLPLVTALVSGYERAGQISAPDREVLLIELRAAAARFTITRITDVYLAAVDQPEKDFRAFLARSEAWRGPALGQLAALL